MLLHATAEKRLCITEEEFVLGTLLCVQLHLAVVCRRYDFVTRSLDPNRDGLQRVGADALGALYHLDFSQDAAVGVALALIRYEVAQRVDGDKAVGGNVWLHDVWVRADDEVYTIAVEELGELALFARRLTLILDAPVHTGDYAVDILVCAEQILANLYGVDAVYETTLRSWESVGAVGVVYERELDAL